MTFTFWVLPKVPPILSIEYLVKHYGFSFYWELDDGQEAMRIKLPQGEIMDSLLVNDVPRIFVANKGDDEQALDSQAVDREDKTSPEAADADQEDVVQRPQVPKRSRKSRARTITTPEAMPMEQLKQPHVSSASTPENPNLDDVMPP